jgi:hypothetical protein
MALNCEVTLQRRFLQITLLPFSAEVKPSDIGLNLIYIRRYLPRICRFNTVWGLIEFS